LFFCKVEIEENDNAIISQKDFDIFNDLEVKQERRILTEKEEAKESRRKAMKNYQKTEAYK
jgi:hypothetical protein